MEQLFLELYLAENKYKSLFSFSRSLLITTLFLSRCHRAHLSVRAITSTFSVAASIFNFLIAVFAFAYNFSNALFKFLSDLNTFVIVLGSFLVVVIVVSIDMLCTQRWHGVIALDGANMDLELGLLGTDDSTQASASEESKTSEPSGPSEYASAYQGNMHEDDVPGVKGMSESGDDNDLPAKHGGSESAADDPFADVNKLIGDVLVGDRLWRSGR
jgi:hypothetical protein